MPGFLLYIGRFDIGLGVCSMGLYRTGSSQACHARFAVDEGGDSGGGFGDGEDDSISCVLEAPVSMMYGERGLAVKRDVRMTGAYMWVAVVNIAVHSAKIAE